MGNGGRSDANMGRRVKALNCTELPALNNLPRLRSLHLNNLPKVRKVGAELFGSKLEQLEIVRMENWEHPTESAHSDSDSDENANLCGSQVLSCVGNGIAAVSRCLKLRQVLSKGGDNDVGEEEMPCLRHLEISYCDNLTAIPPSFLLRFTALQTLQIENCRNLTPPDLSSLKELRLLEICNCPYIKSRGSEIKLPPAGIEDIRWFGSSAEEA